MSWIANRSNRHTAQSGPSTPATIKEAITSPAITVTAYAFLGLRVRVGGGGVSSRVGGAGSSGSFPTGGTRPSV